MDCPYCQSTHFYTCSNKTNLGYQQYRCRDCHKQYNERTGTPFNFISHRTEVVIMTLYYYYSFKLSLDNVVTVMALRGFHLSHQTVHNWAQRFGVELGLKLRKRRYREATDKWHIDGLRRKLLNYVFSHGGRGTGRVSVYFSMSSVFHNLLLFNDCEQWQ